MKITKKQLRKLLLYEVSEVLNEKEQRVDNLQKGIGDIQEKIAKLMDMVALSYAPLKLKEPYAQAIRDLASQSKEHDEQSLIDELEELYKSKTYFDFLVSLSLKTSNSRKLNNKKESEPGLVDPPD